MRDSDTEENDMPTYTYIVDEGLGALLWGEEAKAERDRHLEALGLDYDTHDEVEAELEAAVAEAEAEAEAEARGLVCDFLEAHMRATVRRRGLEVEVEVVDDSRSRGGWKGPDREVVERLEKLEVADDAWGDALPCVQAGGALVEAAGKAAAAHVFARALARAETDRIPARARARAEAARVWRERRGVTPPAPADAARASA